MRKKFVISVAMLAMLAVAISLVNSERVKRGIDNAITSAIETVFGGDADVEDSIYY